MKRIKDKTTDEQLLYIKDLTSDLMVNVDEISAQISTIYGSLSAKSMDKLSNNVRQMKYELNELMFEAIKRESESNR